MAARRQRLLDDGRVTPVVWLLPLRSISSASASKSSAVRSRASQIAELPARSACSRYQDARSRSLDGSMGMGSFRVRLKLTNRKILRYGLELIQVNKSGFDV